MHVRDLLHPAAFAAAYLPSPELEADMPGFDVSDIIAVEDLLLDPVAGSPLGVTRLGIR
ncbi:hypothetical protein GCM10010310_39690 [Streptomyces violaceolatus]|uniref:Uncharacterized protein n=2 Tax=Streptomyces TaxID=1883 RepID=A0ABN3SXD4_9ACTN|nr:hypothetical protein GCM10010391_69310 [Streptomyces anthocyanicus]